MTGSKENYKFDLGVKGVNTHRLLVEMQSLFGWRDTERLCIMWVQLALVVCCAPIYSKTYQSHLVVIWRVSIVLLYFNLKLYPFLTAGKLGK